MNNTCIVRQASYNCWLYKEARHCDHLQNRNDLVRQGPSYAVFGFCLKSLHCELQYLEILSLYSQYIYSISIYVVKNKHLFHTNNQIHSIHTRFKTNLYPSTANLTKFQKGVYYSTIKIFNNLPHKIKDLANDILPFRNALKRFLLANSFTIVRNILINRDIPLKFKWTISFKYLMLHSIYN